MPFAVSDKIETAYRRTITRLIYSWLPVDLKDVSDEHWLREFASVSSRKSVVQASLNIAKNMITSVNVVNVKDWREAALRTQRSGILYDLLQKELNSQVGKQLRSFVDETSSSITSLPRDVAIQLGREVATAQQQGIRPETLSKIFRVRFPELLDTKIKLLARTQTSSASTALTRARCEQLDLPCFTWETSQDGRRVRPSHRNMQGVVVFWKDLPSPESLIGQKSSLGRYAAGDCPNCRCNPLPILTIEDVFSQKKSLTRVYMNGRIEVMTRANFIKISGIESRMAA